MARKSRIDAFGIFSWGLSSSQSKMPDHLISSYFTPFKPVMNRPHSCADIVATLATSIWRTRSEYQIGAGSAFWNSGSPSRARFRSSFVMSK